MQYKISLHKTSSIRQKSFPDDLTGIRDQHERRRLRLTDEVPQMHGLSTAHGSHDHRLLVMGERALRPVDRGAVMELIDDVIADRIRVVADDIEAFALVDILDDAIHHQGLGQKSQHGEQTGRGVEYEERQHHRQQIHQEKHRADIQAGMLL